MTESHSPQAEEDPRSKKGEKKISEGLNKYPVSGMLVQFCKLSIFSQYPSPVSC